MAQNDIFLRSLVLEYLRNSSELSIIDRKIGSREYGYADFLATDTEHRAIIISLILPERRIDLSSLLVSYQYINFLMPVLPSLYPDARIDNSFSPHLMVLAPFFESRFIRSLEFVDSITIDLQQYAVIEQRGRKKLQLAPIPFKSNKIYDAGKNLEDLKHRLKSGLKDASDEEIETFYNFYK